ncbi:MAG: hypothetical protein AB8B85_11500 [Paracoccaceae bacterium]
MQNLDWTMIGGIAGVIGVIIAVIALFWRKKPAPTSKTKISIKGSPGAEAVGRDKGGDGDAGPHEAEIDIEDSQNARSVGRDDRE